MLCSRHLVKMLSVVLDTVVPIDDATVTESAQAEPEGSAMSMTTASPSNAAYVIFTSGSTGKPKVSRHTLGSSAVVRELSVFFFFLNFLFKFLTFYSKTGYRYRTPGLLLQRPGTCPGPAHR